MRWQRFVSGIRLSRLFKGLILVVVIKIAFLGAMILSTPLEHLERAAMQRTALKFPAEPAPNVFKARVFSQAMAQEAPTPEAQPDALPASKDSLMQKQEELNRREQSLKALEKEIDEKLVRLQELEASLKVMLEQAKELKDDKLKHLIDVYSNMKAKQAASVLETLDEKIAVKILAGMSGRQAGEILSFVNSEKAARLTEQLTKMQVPF